MNIEVRISRRRDGSYFAWSPYDGAAAEGPDLPHVMAELGRKIEQAHYPRTELSLAPRESATSRPNSTLRS